MDALISFVNSFVEILKSAFLWVADALVSIIWGILYIIFDGFLTLIAGIIGAIDISTLVSQASVSWGLLPGPLVYLINQTGIPQGLAILGYSYVIRFTLNLIPSSITRI